MTGKTRKNKMKGEAKAQELKLETYTVIGMFGWDERHSEVMQAESAEQAEFMFNGEADRIAGVLAGAHEVDPVRVHEEPIEYTVIAYYPDNDQRYAAAVQACSTAEAEEAAIVTCNRDNGRQEEGSEDFDLEEFDPEIIVICGAVEGDHQIADVYAGGEGSVYERGDVEGAAHDAWLQEQEEGSSEDHEDVEGGL
jgi:hypothetical protein